MHSIMHKTKLFQSSHVRDDNNMSEVNQKIKYLHSKFTNKNCVVVTKSPTNKQLEIEFESCSSSVVMMMMMTRKKCHVQTCMCLQNIQCLNFIKALISAYQAHSTKALLYFKNYGNGMRWNFIIFASLSSRIRHNTICHI